MKFAPVLLGLVPGAFAAVNPSWLSGLTSKLSSLGLDKFASALTNTSNIPDVLNTLSTVAEVAGTILCPEDAAFLDVASNVLSDAATLAPIISNHFLKGSHPAGSIATSPEHSVTHSFLDDPAYVSLPADIGQAVILTVEDGVSQILNQGKVVSIKNTTTYENLVIHIIDSVLEIPPNFSGICSQFNLTAIVQFIATIGLDLNTTFSAPGLTVFVPLDTAFSAIASDITATATTSLQTLLSNHIINGSAVFSDQFTGSASFTSSGGEPFSFAVNASGSFVIQGSASATLITQDIPFSNGAIHLIDRVLFDTNSNPAAASSAYTENLASETQEAAEQSASISSVASQGPAVATATAGATGTATGSGSSSSETCGKSSASRLDFASGTLAVQILAMTAAVFGGAAMLV